MIEPDLRLRAVVPAPLKLTYEALTDPAALRVWLAEHAEVELPGTLPAGARADTSVDGIIDIDVVPNAVYVARPAGVQPESTSEVFRLDARDVEAERVAVRFGRASVANILVLDGLRPGDRILTSDVSQWAGFDRIRLE